MPYVAPGGDVDHGEAPANLTGTVVRGLFWKISSRVVAEATRVAVVVVLARLLTPSDYGVAGMALVVASFAAMCADPALGAALIQRPRIDEEDRSTIFWMATGAGLALTIVGIVSAGLVADFFGEPEVEQLFAFASLTFVVISLSTTPRAILARRLAYRSLELREMGAIVVGGIVAITLGVAGYGPWAIVANFVAYALTSTLLIYLLVDWRPRALFSSTSARDLGGFSARIFSATLLNWGNANLDKALVGRFLGSAALGTYSMGYNAMLMPVGLLGRPLHQVLSPAYSRIQSDKERLERAWLRGKRLSVAVLAPALVGLIVAAPEFVQVLLGDQWDGAVVPLQLLCVGALADSLGAHSWTVVQARGQARALLRLTVLSSVVTWAAFAAGLPWGIVGVAAFYAGARWLLVVPTLWLTARAVSFDFWASLWAGAGLLPVAFAAGAVAFGARELLLGMDLAAFFQLVIVSLVMLGAYVALLLLVTPSVVREIRDVLERGRGEDRSPDGQRA